MKLDYSIITFVRRGKLADSLNWLSERLYDHGESKHVRVDGDYIKISGEYFSDYRGDLGDASLNIDDGFNFSSSLIFDIDPVIINSLCNSYPNNFNIEVFKDNFENYYLGNGKIKIGSFKSEIDRHEKYNVYQITFTASTTGMNQILIDSISVKNWIEEFSKISDAVVSYIDMENSGHKILFYKGKKIDFTIDNPYDIPQDEPLNFFDEYFKLIIKN